MFPGEGNANPPLTDNKRGSPAKNWTMRWSHYPEDWKEEVIPKFHGQGCLGYVIGAEICPTTGTPHLQGYAQFKNKIRWSAFHLPLIGIEWQAARCNRQTNMDYCSKEGKFVSWGTCEVEEQYTVDITLYDWEKDIVKLLDSDPDNRKLYWFWEAAGNRGKTTFQKWIFLNYKDVVVLSGKASDMKNGIMNYKDKNKKTPKIVLINIPQCTNMEHVSWAGLEEIKDMFFFSGKYEGGMVCGKSPHMLIFSNDEPPREKMSQDRWVVRNI